MPEERREDSRPVFNFDFSKTDSLRERLIREAEQTLQISGRPQRQMAAELHSLFQNRSSDTTVYQVLRIINRYLKVIPFDFEDLIHVLGLAKALEFIQGVRPPDRVWRTLHILRMERADDALIKAFWGEILDMLEGGEENYWLYVTTCLKYRYWLRGLKPGYDRPSKEMVLAYRSA